MPSMTVSLEDAEDGGSYPPCTNTQKRGYQHHPRSLTVPPADHLINYDHVQPQTRATRMAT